MKPVTNPAAEKAGGRVHVLVYVALTAVCLALTAFISVMVFSHSLLSKVQYETERPAASEEEDVIHEARDKMPAVSLSDRPVAVKNEIIHILLVGGDNQGSEIHGRSDAMILCSINTKTRKIHLTSLMRAIYVSIPKDPDPDLAKYWSPNHALNSAHSWGGSRLLVKTVKRNFRVNVNKYIEVDFRGFTEAVDTLGGVSLMLTEAEAAHLNALYGTSLPAGENLLDGKMALAYSRIRKIDTDFVRTSRQRKVIQSLFQKWKNASPEQLIESAKSVLSCIKTNYTEKELLQLILQLPSFMNYEMDQLMLPIEEGKAVTYINGKELYNIDWDSNLEALFSFIEN